MTTESPKPPLGLMPEHIWKDKRASEIMRAIIRYEDANMTVPWEWTNELVMLMEYRNRRPLTVCH